MKILFVPNLIVSGLRHRGLRRRHGARRGEAWWALDLEGEPARRGIPAAQEINVVPST